jgi:type IV pilus assembly protein PilZ
MEKIEPLISQRPGILELVLKDKAALYAASMPFIQQGGLFIPTSKKYKMGEEIYLLLSLFDNNEKIAITGTVCWITPTGAQGNRTAGIGIQFNSEEGFAIKNKIDNFLKEIQHSDRPTHTL